MEKRLVSFLLLTAAILVASQLVNNWINPQVPEVVELNGDDEAGDPADPQPAAEAADNGDSPDTVEGQPPVAEVDGPLAGEEERVAAEPVWLSLGSLDPNSPYRILACLNSRGAAVESITLNDKYYDLVDKSGYLGFLALTDEPDGITINVVGAGTPAAMAQPVTPTAAAGLRPGDVIKQFNADSIRDVDELKEALRKTVPGQNVELTVWREGQEAKYTVTLVKRPLDVIRPEPEDPTELQPRHPMSYLLDLHRIGMRKVADIPGFPKLREENWEAKPIEGDDGPEIEFRYTIKADSVPDLNLEGDLILVKRFGLAKADNAESKQDDALLYHLTIDVEFEYQGESPLELSYELYGPTGLPLEGWWYTYKTHPRSFGAGGVRDVVAKEFGGSHKMLRNPEIVETLEKPPHHIEMFAEDRQGTTLPKLEYACVDAQYFTSGLVAAAPTRKADESDVEYNKRYEAAISHYGFEGLEALPVSEEDPLKPSRTDVSFRFISPTLTLNKDGYNQQFWIFAGPKETDVLKAYNLKECITYGWFPLIAKPLTAVLHFFYSIVGNFGVAIILLTVLVRGCMFPLGRQQALNAQKMQELAPEMKQIAEKYKDDMEKRAAAQRELFSKNNYNPLAGCLPVFFQLPIFIGLYRALSVDIALRDAPLIPGISWASNLAGPDQLWFWEPYMPAFLASPTGWLGPYLNILPLVSVAFMMVHQKLFTPPPTDEQQEMQHKIMKFMMIFFGFMFFRVPAGLCLYFITSSAWGLAERKLLPKPKTDPNKPQQPSLLTRLSRKNDAEPNGAAKVAEARKQRQKRR